MLTTSLKPTAHPRRGPGAPHESDDTIPILCVTVAVRSGHTQRDAECCEIDMTRGGGSVGCPGCPYNLPDRPGIRLHTASMTR